MTEKLHYQDVFKTIHIPKSERRLALKTKDLFDIVHGEKEWDPSVHEHLSHVIDTHNASQVFWEFEDDDNRLYDRLALTIMKRGLTIALEHRDFNDKAVSIRQSLVISNGGFKVYNSDLGGRALLDQGSATPESIAIFKDNFIETTANLGLRRHIKRISTDQNESDSARFASAA